MTRFVTKTTLCSTLAIATAMIMAPQRAGAQVAYTPAFQGTFHDVSGISSISEGPGFTTINVAAPQAVINWDTTGSASNGVVTFQGSGTTATFSSGGQDFAVLNRVNANGNAIKLDGTINSQVGDFVGGTVYFSSADGIIIGSNAVINVGSLGLTTLPIADDGLGNWMTGFGTTSPQVTFGAAVNPNSYITVESSAQLNANGGGNYVALVSPKITHSGIIRTDGGAALVAAKEATVTFRTNNLYDIAVTQGSNDANGVVVNGGTIARNDPTAGLNHRAYLMAVPANSAMTMIIQNGASLGFDIAGSAVYENNAVVLTTGRDIGYGYANGVSAGAGSTDADIQISKSSFGSNTVATASDNFHAGSDGGLLNFSGDLSVEAARGQIDSQGAQGLTKIGGNLYVTTDRYGGEGGNSIGGNFTLLAVSGSTLEVDGSTYISADGYGGGSQTDGLAAGNGTGGQITVQSQAGSTIDLLGYTSLNANGYGGGVDFSTSLGGNGIGGKIFASAVGAGALVHVGGGASFDAIGYGAGANNECTSCAISGGNGVGGKIFIDTYQTGSARIAFDSYLNAHAEGRGGGGTGPLTTGNATGGTVRLYQTSTTGNITVAGSTTLSADADGAYSNDGVSGAGTGGLAQILALGGQISLSGNNYVSAIGTGGDTGGDVGAGRGQGGSIQINTSTGSTVTLGDYFNADASGNGGIAFNDLGTGGMGQGGNVTVQMSGGQLNGATTMDLLADGYGGGTGNDCTSPCGYVGAIGIGGTAAIYGGAAGSTIVLGATTNLSAIGVGASGGTGTGGLGNGGTTTVFTNGGTISGGNLSLNSSGSGGQSGSAAGGVSTGGTATLQLDGGSVTLTGDVLLDVTASAGWSDSGAGSTATGGNAHIYLFSAGAGLDIGGTTNLDASAFGGTSIGGNGGAAIAGFAEIYATGGTAHFVGDTTVQANATGGGSTDGDGATGTGGKARVTSLTSAFTFDAALSTHANATGGYGVNGGNATGAVAGGFIISGLVARNGGSIAVAGNTMLTATTVGGAAHSNGNGGNAASSFQTFDANDVVTGGGFTGIVVSGDTNGAGSVTLAGLSVDTSAVGGVGGGGVIGLAGGNGGAAHSGDVQIVTRNSNSGTNLIRADSMAVNADATGGNGGLGGDGSRAGGSGGDATSGFVGVTGSAGNGRVVATTLNISGIATGGDGGRGGFADFPDVATGNGGNGGNALASGSGVGVVSVLGSTTSYGSASFDNVAVDTSAHGGDGGNAGSGSPTLGSAGDGGFGAGGWNILYSRGGNVQVGSMTVDARGYGGDGGLSNSGGIGGNGYAGSIQALSTTRNLHPEQVGSLIVGSFLGDASAYAGGGVTKGIALIDPAVARNGLGVQVLGGSTAQFGSLDLLQNAVGGATSTLKPAFIEVIGSTLTVTNGLSISTGGNMRVVVDNGSVTAGSVNLGAGNFIHTTGYTGAGSGTISADSINVTTGNNIIIDANLDSTGIDNSLYLNALGLIQTGALTSVNDVNLTAGNYISTLGINAGGSIYLDAAGLISASDLNAGGDINVVSDLGTVSTGNISSPGSVMIASAGSMTILDVLSGNLTLNSDGAISAGNINASGFVSAIAGFGFAAGTIDGGGLVTLTTAGAIDTSNITSGSDIILDGDLGVAVGNLTAGDSAYARSLNGAIGTGNIVAVAGVTPYDVQLSAATSLDTGTIDASGFVLLVAGTDLTAGAINATAEMLGFAGGAMTLGAINASYVLLGDDSMAAAGGDPFGFYLPSLAIAQAPVRSGGLITIGNVSAGGINASAGGNFSGGALVGLNELTIDAGGNVSAASLQSLGTDLINADGSITIGGATGGAAVDFTAGGAITTGAINSGSWVDVLGGGNILVGAVRSADYTDLDSGGSLTGTTISAGSDVALWGETGVTVGAIDAGIVNPDTSIGATYDIGIGSGPSGNIVTGALTAAGNFLTGAGGNLTTGAIQAGGDVLAMVGGDASFGAIGLPGTLGVTGYDMLAIAGGKGNFDQAIVFAALVGGTASSTGGDVTFTGAVSASDIYVLAGGSIFGLNFGGINELLFGAGGDITVGSLITGGNIDASAGGALTINGVLEGFALNLNVGTDLTIGDITSNSAINFSAAGNLTVGNLTTEPLNQGGFAALIAPSPLDISLRSGADLTTGVLVSGGSIYLGADGSISAQQMTAVGAVLALAAGDISTGAITAGDEVYVAGIGDEARGGFIGDGFDPGPVVASAPDSFAASISTGAISGTRVTLAASGDIDLPSATSIGAVSIAGDNVTAGALSATTIDVTAAGLAIVGDTWSAGAVNLTSNVVSVFGTINGGAVRVESTNANGMFLGDGPLPPAGYILSANEIDQISGSSLAFVSSGGESPALTINNLSLDASAMTGSEIIRFEAGGSIKIVGDLAVNGLTDPARSIGFYAPLFMLDSSTGSLALNNGSAPGGTLNIYAHDAWVADGAILARLLADPNYAGRDAELAVAPDGVSGPVISANIINVQFNDGGPRNVTPYTLLVQNSGDATVPQGFLATEANATLGEGASGLIDMVINGQGQTDSGIVSGVAVRDALMEGDNPARFTANSTINGCSVAGGSCGQTPPPPPPTEEPPPPPIADPGVVIADEIVLFSAGADEKPLFGNEEQIVQNLEDVLIDGGGGDPAEPATAEEQEKKKKEAAEEASSPIAPPTPLFDTRPLNATNSTDEPISGGGNPALIGSGVEPTGGQ